MQIIPVLDLKDGRVVRGVMGDRAAYRPIETPLSATAEPLDVLSGLMGLYPFEAVYLADLDAIGGGEPDIALYGRLAEAQPDCRFWIDGGLKDRAGMEFLRFSPALRPVAGSETLSDASLLADPTFRHEGILSLDFRGDAFVGDLEVLERAENWPERLIVMTLARVGSGLGPDLARLSQIAERAGPERRVYAAGGLRGADDLDALNDLGLAGVLVASALHDGRLTAGDIRRAGCFLESARSR